MFKTMLAALCAVVSIAAAGSVLAAPSNLGAENPPLTAAEQAQVDKINGILSSIKPQYGAITLPSAKVRMDLGEAYAFLKPEDAKKVLVDIWQNPPEAADGVLGMIFPRGVSVLDEHSWSAVLTYEPTGYVSDEHARSEDYEKVLTEMMKDALASNEQRKKEGYPTIEVVGWAQPPLYDQAGHNLIWARDLRFGDNPEHNTLNYDVRHLGRFGVLSMNVVASMQDLPAIKSAAAQLARTVEFDTGSRYAEHQAMDKKAAYGLAGLVAAGAGLIVAKKVGMIALILLFAKKGAVVIAALGAALAARFKGLIGKKPKGKTDPANPPALEAPEPDEPRSAEKD